MKKICVITGTRAEYGLLRWIIEGIQQSNTLKLQLLATGMHLSPEFGMTVDCIEKDGFKVDRKVEMLLSSDTPVGIAKSTGLATISMADAFNELSPDLIVLLGDRFELLAASTAALFAKIPIAHLHGGEKTEGAYDEAIRHSITKMSHLHFVATEEYRKRVIQLGEDPKRVFNVGGLGVDNIQKLNLLSLEDLEKKIDFEFREKNFLITFHPVTLAKSTSEVQMQELLNSLMEFQDFGLIFTMPNSDTDGRILFKMIEEFCFNNVSAKCYLSLGQLNYLSCMKYVDVVIGNSSSGLLEAPSFKVPTVNIGDRQKGRLKAKSVVDSLSSSKEISKAIEHAMSLKFKESLFESKSIYGEGGASKKVVDFIEQIAVDKLVQKEFYDLY